MTDFCEVEPDLPMCRILGPFPQPPARRSRPSPAETVCLYPQTRERRGKAITGFAILIGRKKPVRGGGIGGFGRSGLLKWGIRHRKPVIACAMPLRFLPSAPCATIEGHSGYIVDKATRKRRTREHVIADLAVNYVERQVLLRGHAVNRTSPGQDYGVDLVVLTFDENRELENGQIEIQVRATEQVQPLKGADEFSQRLETTHVSHWVMQPFPVILAVYDTKQERARWLNIQRAAEQRQLDDRGESVTVRIPLANELNHAAIEEFRRDRNTLLDQLQQAISKQPRHGDNVDE